MKKKERLSKKTLAMALVMIMIVGLIPGNAFAQTHNTMETEGVAFTVGEAGYWTGDTWVQSDATPYIQADRIMVPVAHASRALGAEVTWKAETKEVEVKHHDDTYTLTIGSTQLQKNGEALEEMDTIPVIQNIGNGLGRTMLPVSRLAKVLEVDYTWDPDTKTATFMPMAEEGPVVYDEAGTYGPEEDIETIDNDVIISADGVILQNMIITGTLTITEAVGDGDVTLNNITVEDDTLIQGGGTDSIYINGGSFGNIIVQRTPTGAVRIVVTGQNSLNIEVDEEAEEQILILEGFYDKVIVNAPNVRIITRGETQINELIITGSASNTTLETSDDTTIDKVVVDGEDAVFEGASGTVKEVEGDEKDSLYDKDNVVVTTTRRSGGGSSSKDNDDEEEIVEESFITNAEVDITSGSIVFGYTFYEEAEEVTYLEATEAPYYLDALNSYVELINGEDSAVKDFDQLSPTDDGQVVYVDLDDIIAFWWDDPADAFVPEQIRIYLTPTDQGNWDAFEVVRDLTEVEASLFIPPDLPPSEFAGGEGTEANPYQVATAQQLNNVRDHLDKYFIQIADIDLEDMEWVPIGEFSSGSQFIGSYDGNNKTIDNLTIVPDASDQYIGLFGVIGYDWEAEIYAHLSNINLINVTITGTELHSVGSLAGRANNNTTIENCSASGEITATDDRGYAIGGLVGDNSATITNSEANVTIYVSPTGTGSKAGGLAGHNGGDIDNCFATGDVTGNEYVGGLLGWHTNKLLTNSYSTGNVTGDESVGGLIGLAWSITEKCFSNGNVSGNSAVGGLIGNLPGYARNVYAAGSVSDGGSVGGLVGFYSGGGSPAEITNAYAYGQVSGSSNTGGLVGEIWESSSDAPITASYWDTETTGKSNSVGGTGYVTSAMIKATNSVPIYEGWDFDNIWTIQEGQSYPYFQWQVEEDIPYPPSPFAGGLGTSEDPFEIANAEQLNQVRNYLNKHFIQIADINLGAAPWNDGEGWEPIGDYLGEASFRGVYDGDNYEIEGLFINRPEKYAVGLFGEMTNGAVVKNIKLIDVDVTGKGYVGAVSGGWGGVGYEDSSVINVHVSGTVTGTDNVGGLVGTNSTVRQSSSTANVQGSFAGGLVGLNRQNHAIEKSYATGVITGTYTGGLVGHNNYGTILNSFSLAQVKGTGTQNGGVIGVGYSFGSVLSSVFAAGAVDSGGGLIGVNHNGGTNWELSSYWDEDTTGCDASANSDSSFGKTIDEMKMQSTYDGWDFDTIWGMNSDENDGYPFLRWQGFAHIEPLSVGSEQTVTQQVYEEDEIAMNLIFPDSFEDLSNSMDEPKSDDPIDTNQLDVTALPVILVQYRKLI